MRVLLASDGTWGDVGPLLAICRELGARGHEIRAHLNPSFAEEAERLGFATRRVGVSWEVRLVDADPRLMTPLLGTIRVLRDYLVADIPNWLAATQEALACFRPDVGLFHHLSWGSMGPARESRLPFAATFLAPSPLLSVEDPGRPVDLLPPPPKPVSRASYRLLRALFRRLLDAPARKHFEAAGLAAPRDLYWMAPESAAVSLGLWSPTFRGPAADDPDRFEITGYAFPDEGDPGAPLSPELEAFLASGEPPVVVTLGTSASRVGLDLYRAAAEACHRIKRRAVLLTGGPEATPATLPEGVIAVQAAPHGKLMARSCAVLHHAGAGTAGQALRAGVPAVIVPYGHDQHDNAHRAAALGGSKRVRRSRANAARLAAALAKVLGDARIREAARRAGARIRSENGALEAALRVEKIA